MSNYIIAILKLKGQNKNLNINICFLQKQKDDIKSKIDTYNSIGTKNKELHSLKVALREQYSIIFPLLLCFVSALAMIYLFVLKTFALNIFGTRLLLGLVSALMIYTSTCSLLKTFKSIKKYKLKIKNKGSELDNIFSEVNSYGITKENLITNSYILESQIFNNQKMIEYNNIKINELKQDIINHYIKNNVNIKTLKEATKVKKLSK